MVRERLKLKIDLSQISHEFGKISCLGDVMGINEVYGIANFLIHIKKKEYRQLLHAYLSYGKKIDIIFEKKNKSYHGYLRQENRQFYLTQVNMYLPQKPAVISLYNSHGPLWKGEVEVTMIEGKYLLEADTLKHFDDGKYLVIYNKKAYNCMKMYNTCLYFSRRDRK